MNKTISYKINQAYCIPYSYAIDEKKMKLIEETNEIVSNSQIYLICKVRKPKFFSNRRPKPEVLYVGETFNKKKRFKTHNKLLKATSIINHDELLFIYFLNIRFSCISINPLDNPLDVFMNIKDRENKSSVRLLERFFIKLFRPCLNNLHNNEIIQKDNLMKSELINENVKFVVLDIGMDSHYFSFMGGFRQEKEDWYLYDLVNEKIIIGEQITSLLIDNYKIDA